MKWLELHNVEYGECVVLGGHRDEVLMVDCGSMNQKVREGDTDFAACVEPGLMDRYAGSPERGFLLTHYHRDHLCGLVQLLKADANYFTKIMLPCTPTDGCGQPLLLEFALFVYAFTAHLTDFSRANMAALKIFDKVAGLCGAERLVALGEGSSFDFDGVTYDVLWPRVRDYPFSPLFAEAVEELNVRLSSPYLPQAARDFLAAKESFCRAYLNMCKPTQSGEGVKEEDIADCKRILHELEALRPALELLPAAADVQELLGRPVTREAYAEEHNAASVVFHNRRAREASLDDLLMTGDVTAAALEEIGGALYNGYYIVKAPHHGTASHWSPLFAEIGISHLLVSNGDYQNGGKVAREYIDLPCVKHCANHNACPFFAAGGCSCNRLMCCFDMPGPPGLTLKCPKVRQKSGPAPCGIYVVAPCAPLGKTRACLCDDSDPIIF